METDLIFGNETSDMLTGAEAGDTQIAAVPSTAAPFDDALTRPFDAAQVVIPQGADVVRIAVTPGEIVELPFPSDAQFLARIDNGNLAIKVGDVTVILQGYVEAAGQTAPVIEAANGQPLDIATILASTDPNIDIQTAAGPAAGPQGQGADNTGGILTQFGEGAGLGGFEGAGAPAGTDGLGGGIVDQTGTLFVQFGLAALTTPNTAPTALDDSRTITEDGKITNGQVTANDPEGDALTYSLVGALPAGVVFNADGSYTFDTSGNYESLNVGDKNFVTFQYKANDGTSDSNVATVTIEIDGVNDAPQYAGGQYGYGFPEDAAKGTAQLNWIITDVDDPAGSYTITVKDPGALPPGVTYNPATDTFNVVAKGNYDYLPDGVSETFIIPMTITDPHGGTAEKDFILTIGGTADAQDAVNDVILSNAGINAGATIPDWALTINDKDGGLTHTFGLSGVFSGLFSSSEFGGNFGFIDNGTLGGQSGIKLTDGSTSAVDIHNQAGGDITGTSADEILVGSAAAEKLDGGGGNDVIFGKGGSDEIFGGAGDDVMVYSAGSKFDGGSDTLGDSLASGRHGDVLAFASDLKLQDPADAADLHGIETLSMNANLGGAGAQSLTIGAASVQQISDHTLTPGGVFTSEHDALRVDGDAVDQLYLSISKDGAGTGWADTGVDVNGYSVYAHETTAGDATTADAYVMVSNAIPAANVHVNADQP
jgi:VCBS repeat-containing protein